MKKVIYLFLTLFLISCSKDDETSNDEAVSKNFLEQYDDYAFQNDDEYIYFINDGEYFLTVFVNEGEDSQCISVREGNYPEGDIFYDAGEVRIVTNDSESFAWEFIYQYDGVTYRDSYEYTVNSTGNRMTIIYDGDSNDNETLVKISATVSEYCN